MEEMKPQDFQQALAKVSRRAATDAEFRARALGDPNAVIEEAAGKKLPAEMTIKLIENEGATFTFVLPDPQKEELSESELEQMAGGFLGQDWFHRNLSLQPTACCFPG